MKSGGEGDMSQKAFCQLFFAALLLLLAQPSDGGRAEDAIFLDGKQGDFADTIPPDPGYMFVTPARVTETALPTWYEFADSFTIDAWIRPSQLFLGTEIEGGIISCLVSDPVLARYSGWGVTTSGANLAGKLNFYATQASNQGRVSGDIEAGFWYHFAAVFQAGTTTASSMVLYINGVSVDSHTFPNPGGLNFWPAEDLQIGRHTPATGVEYFYAGLIDEMRIWNRALGVAAVRLYQYSTIAIADGSDLAILAYWPMNQAVCTAETCRADSQQWNPSDDGLFVLGSSPASSPKCLAVLLSSVDSGLGDGAMEINSCGTSPPDWFRWSRSSTGFLQPAHSFPSCLSVDPTPPYDGSPAILVPCDFSAAVTEVLHMRWDLTSNNQLKNRLTGSCLTAGNNLIGSGVFMIDCFEIVIGETPRLAVDVIGLHHGTFKGGSGFSTRTDSPSTGCCAPIDVAPTIYQIGSQPVTANQDVLATAAVGQDLTLDVYARDDNVNDGVQLLMVISPDGATLTRISSEGTDNPIRFRLTWRPSFTSEWTNPSYAIFQAVDSPTNEYDPNNPATREFSTRASIRISIEVPPIFVFPTPDANSDFAVDFDGTLSFTVRVESRNAGDEVLIEFLEAGPSELNPPQNGVSVTSNTPTLVDTVTGSAELRFNPTSRIWNWAPLPEDAGAVYEVCFFGRKIGAEGRLSKTEVRCVRVRVPNTRPIFLAGTTENNTALESKPGCFTSFRVLAAQNDTSTAYFINVAPSHFDYVLYNGTVVRTSGLPQGAGFREISLAELQSNGEGTFGQRQYEFMWEHEAGGEGQWSICFLLADSLSLQSVLRCVQVHVSRCVRCINQGDSLHSIARLYGAHWLELFSINPALDGRPDLLVPGALLNVGVTMRVHRAQTVAELSRHLRMSARELRLLNPDVPDDSMPLSPGDQLCILPTTCGTSCGGSSDCDRPPAWQTDVTGTSVLVA